MGISQSRAFHRLVRAAGAVAVVTTLASAGSAEAYTLRTTPSGIPVRWSSNDLSLELDPSLVAAVPGAVEAAAAAASAWSEPGVGPRVDVSLASSPSSPAVDGRNVVYYIPGFPAAGDALAVTLVSYDDVTGAIVDTDIVINGTFDFAVLPPDARAPVGVSPIANEPLSTTSAATIAWGATGAPSGPVAAMQFDLVHVLVHETGHVLGLRDTSDAADVMFLLSSPGDAAGRSPTADDLAGIATLYRASASGASCAITSASRAGDVTGPCGGPLLVILTVAVTLARRQRRLRPTCAVDPAEGREA